MMPDAPWEDRFEDVRIISETLVICPTPRQSASVPLTALDVNIFAMFTNFTHLQLMDSALDHHRVRAACLHLTGVWPVLCGRSDSSTHNTTVLSNDRQCYGADLENS